MRRCPGTRASRRKKKPWETWVSTKTSERPSLERQSERSLTMSEAPSDPGQPPRGQEAIDRRAWPRDKQARMAGLLAVVVCAVLAAVWLGDRLFGKREAPASAAPSPPGTFRATPQPLKSLTVESAGQHPFVSEELTEGKFAVNGDRATPVFSPYSGRVARVIAGLGDAVKAGAPLATLEASEFVQAQNDLRSG